MTTFHWLSLVTCAGHLAFVGLALGRRSARPLSSRLAALALALFVWNAADLAADLDPTSAWDRLDHVAATVTTPLALHFVVDFVGPGRFGARLVRLAYLFYAGLAAVVLGAAGFGGAPAWAGLVLAGVAPSMGYAVARLLAHERAVLDAVESSRTRLVLLALGSGLLFGTTDLARILGLEVPRLSNVGTLLSVVLLAVAVLRSSLLEARPTALQAGAALGSGLLAIVAYLLAFEYAGARPAALALLITAITGAGLGLARRTAFDRAARRARLTQDATLGRFARQLAHDLKNPLAVVQGAVQFLEEERAQGRSIDAQVAFLEQIRDEVGRMRRVIAGFDRIGRVEARFEPVSPVELVRSLAFGFQAAAPEGVQFELQASDLEGRARLDPDLLRPAIENLLDNAVHAVGAAGRIVLGFEARAGRLHFFVRDDGPGMDPRVRARAPEDFFTTKEAGSGLGLAFARRVAAAHGGWLQLEGGAGRGTVASLVLPRELRR